MSACFLEQLLLLADNQNVKLSMAGGSEGLAPRSYELIMKTYTNGTHLIPPNT